MDDEIDTLTMLTGIAINKDVREIMGIYDAYLLGKDDIVHQRFMSSANVRLESISIPFFHRLLLSINKTVLGVVRSVVHDIVLKAGSVNGDFLRIIFVHPMTKFHTLKDLVYLRKFLSHHVLSEDQALFDDVFWKSVAFCAKGASVDESILKDVMGDLKDVQLSSLKSQTVAVLLQTLVLTRREDYAVQLLGRCVEENAFDMRKTDLIGNVLMGCLPRKVGLFLSFIDRVQHEIESGRVKGKLKAYLITALSSGQVMVLIHWRDSVMCIGWMYGGKEAPFSLP